MSGRKISPLSRIGSAIFIVCMTIVALKIFDVVDLGVPKTVLIGGLVASWVLREIGWAKEGKTIV